MGYEFKYPVPQTILLHDIFSMEWTITEEPITMNYFKEASDGY